MKIEELEELLVPMFSSVEIHNYDSTYIARMTTEQVEGTYNEVVDFMRAILLDVLPQARVLDASYIYNPSDRNTIYGWWIQFDI